MACAVILAAASVQLSLLGQDRQDPQRPPTLRSGTNIIRVDATVADRSGRPLTSLTADDFEVREDGKLQTVTSFKFVSADGRPGDDRSLLIRSQSHAAAEAARDDVRTFLIFWDEYHIDREVPAMRARQALTQALLEQFGPSDLVALMDPLTPISAIEFTRDRRALADRAQRLKGRMGDYIPRSAVEEAHLQVMTRLGEIEWLRTQVTASAIEAAAAHLGSLSPGRKTLIVLTQALMSAPSGIASAATPGAMGGGAGRRVQDLYTMAVDITRVANDSNTAIHVIDPRGLEVNPPLFDDPLETMASGTGGDLLRTNDIPGAVGRMVRQVSALYLLGYSREMPLDGLFHRISVRVKRDGVDVRARSGYWAPRAEDVEAARSRAAAAVLPRAVATAFSSLLSPSAPHLIEVWCGVTPLGSGRVELTVAWAPRSEHPSNPRPVSVSAVVSAGREPSVETPIEPGGTAFEVASGPIELVLTVKDPSGEIIDRETRKLDPTDGGVPLALVTPVVYRSRTPAELRGILTTVRPPVHASRIFTRSDRLIVRTRAYGAAAGVASIQAHLINRRAVRLVSLPVQRAPIGEGYQVDLPLSSIAAGEFAIVFEAAAGDARAESIVPFRVVR